MIVPQMAWAVCGVKLCLIFTLLVKMTINDAKTNTVTRANMAPCESRACFNVLVERRKWTTPSLIKPENAKIIRAGCQVNKENVPVEPVPCWERNEINTMAVPMRITPRICQCSGILWHIIVELFGRCWTAAAVDIKNGLAVWWDVGGAIAVELFGRCWTARQQQWISGSLVDFGGNVSRSSKVDDTVVVL